MFSKTQTRFSRVLKMAQSARLVLRHRAPRGYSLVVVPAESVRGDLLPSQSMAATKITVNNNGSIRIEGDFSMHDAEGKEFGLGGRTVISLCRCGHSANKPFCDGSHKVNGFDSACAARDLPPKV